MKLWEALMEEVFFFMYHMHQSERETLKMPINERKWLIERFVVQKNKENEAMDAARRNAKKK